MMTSGLGVERGTLGISRNILPVHQLDQLPAPQLVISLQLFLFTEMKGSVSKS